jgi:hypothetical protein
LKIKATIQRLPGGMMIVPLLIGCFLSNLASARRNILARLLVRSSSAPSPFSPCFIFAWERPFRHPTRQDLLI